MESVFVIQATLPPILYEVPVPVLGANRVRNPGANSKVHSHLLFIRRELLRELFTEQLVVLY